MKVLSCFDYSTNMVKPWANTGFDCYCVDITHPTGITKVDDNISLIGDDILKSKEIWELDDVFITFFAPPCTHLAVSGARWFKDKGLGKLIDALSLFKVSVDIAQHYNVPYLIENPVSTVSTYWRKPDYTFNPWQYGDNYTKKTCLWTGNGFIMPQPIITDKPIDVDNRIFMMPPSEDRGMKRSITPMGFANAVFQANHQNVRLNKSA